MFIDSTGMGAFDAGKYIVLLCSWWIEQTVATPEFDLSLYRRSIEEREEAVTCEKGVQKKSNNRKEQ